MLIWTYLRGSACLEAILASKPLDFTARGLTYEGRLDCVLIWTYMRVRQIVCSARKGFYIRCEMSYIVSEMDDVDVFEASEPSQPSSKRRKLLYQETLACQANSVPPKKKQRTRWSQIGTRHSWRRCCLSRLLPGSREQQSHR